MPLTELKGFSPELIAMLSSAGYTTLSDLFDLERDDIARIPGMTPASTEQLMAFLAEMTDEESSEEAPSTG